MRMRMLRITVTSGLGLHRREEFLEIRDEDRTGGRTTLSQVDDDQEYRRVCQGGGGAGRLKSMVLMTNCIL